MQGIPNNFYKGNAEYKGGIARSYNMSPFAGTKNTFGIKQVYPTLGNQTSGIAATSPANSGSVSPGYYDHANYGTPKGSPPMNLATMANDGPVDEVQEAVGVGNLGSPFRAWVVLFIALIGLMFGARLLGKGEDFKSIKPSIYNIMVLGFASIIGITFWKLIFTKIKVPGLSTLVLSV